MLVFQFPRDLCTVPPSLHRRECHWPQQVVPPHPSFPRRLHPPVPPMTLHGACLGSVAAPPDPPLLVCCLGKWLWCHHYTLTPPHCGYDCCKVKFSEFTKNISLISAWLCTLEPWLPEIVCYRFTRSHSAIRLISLLQVTRALPDERMSINDPIG